MVGLLWQLFNILKEIFHRTLKLPELTLTLFGFRAAKKLKLRVVVLRDERGRPVAGTGDVMPAYEEARRILALACGVAVEPAGHPMIIAAASSPTAALDVHCIDGAWQDDLGEAGAFFRRLAARTPAGTLLGYGAPVTVFIVRSLTNHGGCSLGVATDYVTLEAAGLRHKSLLLHEVAHACGLWHSKRPRNLMVPIGPGDELTRLQTAILRTSRHVTIY